jgi:glycine cleavage system H protein
MQTLTFMMGEFEAEFPLDYQYATNHMWARPLDGQPSGFRFGFTAYAVRLLQDVYFLDWLADAPLSVKEGQEIGGIESKKAESSLYAPAAGELTIFNEGLLDDPSAINVDKYGDGWLFDMTVTQSPQLMDAAAYIEYLEDVWVKTQRTIKGQLN